jgi:hypothetical protein
MAKNNAEYRFPAEASHPLFSTPRPQEHDFPDVLRKDTWQFDSASLCCAPEDAPSLEAVMTKKLGRQWRAEAAAASAETLRGVDGLFLTGEGESQSDLNLTRFAKRASIDLRTDFF